MRHALPLSVCVLGLAGLAAGCTDSVHETAQSIKRFENRYDPLYIRPHTSRASHRGVEWSQITYVASFQPKSHRLTHRSRQELSRLGSQFSSRGVRVTVLMDIPADDKRKRLLARRRATITSALAREGISASRVRAVPGARHKDAAVVLIGVRSPVIASCREWRSTLAGREMRVESWRFGCVTSATLRAHIDNPSDLVRGRPLGDMDGVNAVKTITDYRRGKLDKLPKAEGTGSGATSSSN